MKKKILNQLRRKGGPLKITIFSKELLGLRKPNNRGACISGIAQCMSEQGNDVTIVICLNSLESQELGDQEFESIKFYYLENYSIKLELLKNSKSLSPFIATHEKVSASIYEFLKENKCDVAYFCLEDGLAFYTLLGKECGTFAECPLLISIANDPIMRRTQTEKFFVSDMQQIVAVHMEIYCAQASDEIICTSSALLAWMKQEKWKLPKACHVLNPPQPIEFKPLNQNKAELDLGDGANELVFFSNNESIGGLPMLCDAVELAIDSLPTDLTITMIGEFDQVQGEHSGGMFLRRARTWPFRINMLPQFTPEDCLSYMKSRNCIAVFPLEVTSVNVWLSACLDSAIPIIATDVGAVREMISKTDHKKCLVEPVPDALAGKLAEAIANPAFNVSPKLKQAEKQSLLSEHVSGLRVSLRNRNSTKKLETLPLVSVIVVHHDRPNFLEQAVQSVENQKYKNIELVIVDDGSTLKASHDLLDRLENKFKRRNWKIIRQSNKYLGAARNLGIKSAKGELIVFLDDDNALMSNSVARFAKAILMSNADICTCFQSYYHGDSVPRNESSGLTHYLPIGADINAGFVSNVFGDATCIIRRKVFDKIGFLNEDYGFAAQDWEFFARASLSGMKLRVIPESLYWYRSSADSMWRNSHWYDNRQPIINLYREHGFEKLELLLNLVISRDVAEFEKNLMHSNLNYSESNRDFAKLSDMDSNSETAIDLLSSIAINDGRVNTAKNLFGRIGTAGLGQVSLTGFKSRTDIENALLEFDLGLSAEIPLKETELRQFQIYSYPESENVPLSYVEDSKLYLHANSGNLSIAVLSAGCPKFCTGVLLDVSLDQAITHATEFIALIVPMGDDPITAIHESNYEPNTGCSGWVKLTQPHQKKTIKVTLNAPLDGPMNLVVATRLEESGDGNFTTACFSGIRMSISIGGEEFSRPRGRVPEGRQRARELTQNELCYARLATDYPSRLPLLILPTEGGLYLRPSSNGIVVAALDGVIPPYVKKILGKVEVADEDSSPFELSMAVALPDRPTIWRDNGPENCIAFSEWKKVERKSQLHDINLDLNDICKYPLTLQLAIRLSSKSKAAPASAHWRKLIIAWED